MKKKQSVNGQTQHTTNGHNNLPNNGSIDQPLRCRGLFIPIEILNLYFEKKINEFETILAAYIDGLVNVKDPAEGCWMSNDRLAKKFNKSEEWMRQTINHLLEIDVLEFMGWKKVGNKKLHVLTASWTPKATKKAIRAGLSCPSNPKNPKKEWTGLHPNNSRGLDPNNSRGLDPYYSRGNKYSIEIETPLRGAAGASPDGTLSANGFHGDIIPNGHSKSSKEVNLPPPHRINRINSKDQNLGEASQVTCCNHQSNHNANGHSTDSQSTNGHTNGTNGTANPRPRNFKYAAPCDHKCKKKSKIKTTDGFGLAPKPRAKNKNIIIDKEYYELDELLFRASQAKANQTLVRGNKPSRANTLQTVQSKLEEGSLRNIIEYYASHNICRKDGSPLVLYTPAMLLKQPNILGWILDDMVRNGCRAVHLMDHETAKQHGHSVGAIDAYMPDEEELYCDDDKGVTITRALTAVTVRTGKRTKTHIIQQPYLDDYGPDQIIYEDKKKGVLIEHKSQLLIVRIGGKVFRRDLSLCAG